MFYLFVTHWPFNLYWQHWLNAKFSCISPADCVGIKFACYIGDHTTNLSIKLFFFADLQTVSLCIRPSDRATSARSIYFDGQQVCVCIIANTVATFLLSLLLTYVTLRYCHALCFYWNCLHINGCWCHCLATSCSHYDKLASLRRICIAVYKK